MNSTTTQTVKSFQGKKAILVKKDGSKWSCELARWLKKGEFEKALVDCKTVHAEVEFPNNRAGGGGPVVVGLSIAEPERDLLSFKEQKQEYEELGGEY
jgi:preprotein translocase subunit SecA